MLSIHGARTLCPAGCRTLLDGRCQQCCWARPLHGAARRQPDAPCAAVSTAVLEPRRIGSPSLVNLTPVPRHETPAEEPRSPKFEELYSQGRELGKGSFATCYQVISKATGRSYCAKKLPKTQLRQTTQHCLAAIELEARILRQLAPCPDVLQIHGVVDASDCAYIITEECTGGTLADYLHEHGPLTEAQAAHAMRTVLSAIAACHSAGIEYGDLKPTNVLLRKPAAAGEILDLALADFGCSQYVDSCGRASSSPGTPLFAAPEVMFKRNGIEADLWSGGVLMYHMLSGQWPFHRPDEAVSPNTVMRRALSAPIQWSAPVWESVSHGAMRLIERMLERDKGERISAKEALRHPWILQHTVAA